MKTKTVLIIGNGFDIAHGLPTKYTDFLDFISEQYEASNAYKVIQSKNDASDGIERIRNSIINILGTDNYLIKYIKNQREKNLMAGENWVDFEQEISRIIRYAELKYYSETDIEDPKLEMKYDAWPLKFNAEDGVKDKNVLHENFYRLSCAFELYVTEIINRIECDSFSEDIRELNPDVVISLNYSNTYERIYSRFRDVDYIHGKADLITVKPIHDTNEVEVNDYRDSNHIILGIDEYLDETSVRSKTGFINFRKYFQRVTKKTGAHYRRYLDADKLDVYVYGHSLDPTDSEIITEIIGSDKAKTTVFYHDEDAYNREVTNLIRVFGRDFIIEKCYGVNPSIAFKRQKSMQLMSCNLYFKFQKSLDDLYHFTSLSSSDFEDAFTVVATHVNTGRGLTSQMDILRVYDVLRTIGFSDEYEEKLAQIAENLPAVNENKELVDSYIYTVDDWAELTPAGEYKTPKDMEDFIGRINDINEKREQTGCFSHIGNDKMVLHEYEKRIPSEVSGADYREFVVRMLDKLSGEND